MGAPAFRFDEKTGLRGVRAFGRLLVQRVNGIRRRIDRKKGKMQDAMQIVEVVDDAKTYRQKQRSEAKKSKQNNHGSRQS